MRIALIHALRHSMTPAEESFHRLWPEAALVNILDDSLSQDLARDTVLTPAMTARFLDLAGYAVKSGAEAILFTCSAFGPCIDACKKAFSGVPVLKPNEAMIDDAIGAGVTVGLLATFAPTLASMPDEFTAVATTPKVVPKLAAGALDAMNEGHVERHDALVVEAARQLSECGVIALAQFSLARAAPAIREATGKIVLTTPDSAVNRLRHILS